MIVKLSASQIESYERCPRRWWYERNRARTQHPSAAYGERVHDVLQSWHEYGTPPDLSTPEGRTAVAGLDLQPPPMVAQAEFSIKFSVDPVMYRGRIDLSFGYVPRESVTICDHKTTSDLRYAKTTDELHDNAQWLIYAEYARRTYGVERILGRWIYYQRESGSRKPKALTVEIEASADEIAERFADLHQRRSLPIVDAQGKHPSELARHFDACGLFPPHGCPFKSECHADATSEQRAAGALGL